MVRFGVDQAAASVRAEVDLTGAPSERARPLVELGVAALACGTVVAARRPAARVARSAGRRSARGSAASPLAATDDRRSGTSCKRGGPEPTGGPQAARRAAARQNCGCPLLDFFGLRTVGVPFWIRLRNVGVPFWERAFGTHQAMDREIAFFR